MNRWRTGAASSCCALKIYTVQDVLCKCSAQQMQQDSLFSRVILGSWIKLRSFGSPALACLAHTYQNTHARAGKVHKAWLALMLRGTWTGLRVMPWALQEYFLDRWRLLPPIPHPTSTICNRSTQTQVILITPNIAPHIHHLQQKLTNSGRSHQTQHRTPHPPSATAKTTHAQVVRIADPM